MGSPAIDRIEAESFTVPTDAPESDGTLDWDSTTIVVVHAWSGGRWGMGYSYTSAAAADIAQGALGERVRGLDAMNVQQAWARMVGSVRNLGWPGLCATAISAVDCALWDLKARLLDVPLASLLGLMRDRVPVYGSGGFTSYSDERLAAQLSGWVEEGIPRVKMKVGRDGEADERRVALARRVIGDGSELMVDANGAYTRKQALHLAERFARDQGVTWFEEPVSSDDREGLRLLRDAAPPPMEIAAGEYAYRFTDFKDLLGAVDCMQADVTRCGGVTGFLQAAALCEANHLPLSAHTAPAQHVHLCSAIRSFRHIEYFHDHVRIERMLFDGVPKAEQGALRPDLSASGTGLSFRRTDAEAYAA